MRERQSAVSESTTTCPNWQADTGASSVQRGQKGTQRETNRKGNETEYETADLIKMHAKIMCFFFCVFVYYSPFFLLFCVLFFSHLPVAWALLKLASASSGSSSATPASISLIQILCARQRRLLRCNCIVIQFKICVLCFFSFLLFLFMFACLLYFI